MKKASNCFIIDFLQYLLRISGMVIFIIAVPVVILFFSMVWYQDIDHINGQELVYSIISPDGAHVLEVYRQNGGATTTYSILCSVNDVDNNKKRNIYFKYREDDVEVYWVDEETVCIEGKELNVYNDQFDSRHILTPFKLVYDNNLMI